jgi:hypothetical protein
MSKDFTRTVVDFEDAVKEIHRELTERGSWIDTLPTNVGETIISMIGGSVAASQHLGIMSMRNAFLSTAVRDSSIYAIVRQQGTHISRRISSSTTVRLKNSYQEALFIPMYSSFDIGGVKYYNSTQLVFTAGQEMDIELTQGEVKTQLYDLDTVAPDFLEFFLNQPDFVVTDDLFVFTTDKVSGTTRVWDKADGGLFKFDGDDYVYFGSTTAKGDVSFIFGDGEYGAKLPRNSVLTVRYVVSQGESANGMLAGVRARSIQYPQLSGQTIAPTTGGANVKSSAYYKRFGPLMFRARDKAISADEIRAKIADYPGVADCCVLGQRDIAPQDRTWMNTMRICILPEQLDSWGGANPNPKSASWTNFCKWLQPQIHAMIEIDTCNPVKVMVAVRVLVAVLSTADPDAIKLKCNEAILKLFQKRPGILKRRLSKSDIRDACKIDGVDYVEVESFNGEESIVLTDPTSYVALQGTPVINVVYTERENS